MADLTKEEQELMDKLTGLGLLPKPKVKREKGDKPPLINLCEHSGTMTLRCICCNSIDKYFVDYLKRVNAEGFVIKRVKKPTHKVTKEHQASVYSCSFCKDLTKYSSEALISMIENLRIELRKGVKR